MLIFKEIDSTVLACIEMLVNTPIQKTSPNSQGTGRGGNILSRHVVYDYSGILGIDRIIFLVLLFPTMNME